MNVTVDGAPVHTVYNAGVQIQSDGVSTASLDIPLTAHAVRPWARIEIDGWIGVAVSVTILGNHQRIEAIDLTTATLRRRINHTTGEYDPSFRFGDVIRRRKDPALGDYMAITPVVVMSLTVPVVFNIADQAEWEIVG